MIKFEQVKARHDVIANDVFEAVEKLPEYINVFSVDFIPTKNFMANGHRIALVNDKRKKMSMTIIPEFLPGDRTVSRAIDKVIERVN